MQVMVSPLPAMSSGLVVVSSRLRRMRDHPLLSWSTWWTPLVWVRTSLKCTASLPWGCSGVTNRCWTVCPLTCKLTCMYRLAMVTTILLMDVLSVLESDMIIFNCHLYCRFVNVSKVDLPSHLPDHLPGVHRRTSGRLPQVCPDNWISSSALPSLCSRSAAASLSTPTMCALSLALVQLVSMTLSSNLKM